METPPLDELFDKRLEYPDPDARRRYAALIGIDDAKDKLIKILGVCVDPSGIEEWWRRHYGRVGVLLEKVMGRPPLIVLAGDVGTGKTALAESVGDPVARSHKINVTLFPISLSARGIGRVGEMTKLISSAFDFALKEAERKMNSKGKSSAGVLLLVDEADALAQSRELEQMHHEDKAGVNAFIRGVDRVAQSRAPMGIIMCTNRLSVIDPAIRRRAAEIIEFSRPNATQCKAALQPLAEVGFSEEQISRIAEITVEQRNGYGFTYSDIVQRLLPTIVLDAYPDSSVRFDRALNLATAMKPTPPFQENLKG
ncbi:MAG: ATP-binding protein [Nitrospira sp.]|nr:ATP-binding protein [Nitrospira sp.]MDE0505634.1 ATP-binding protein [Candidatus Poribacteria bacterium]